jgi:hypothetical protein
LARVVPLGSPRRGGKVSTARRVEEAATGLQNRMRGAMERDDVPGPMRIVRGLGITSSMAYAAGLVSVALAAMMWLLKIGGRNEKAERRAIFVGLWPPTFMAIGKALEGYEQPGR